MKRIVTVFLAIVCSFCLFACKQEGKITKGEPKVFTPVVVIDLDGVEVEEGTVLVAVMKALKEKDGLDFETDGSGMVVAINGKENSADFSSCWLLYTSDGENANAEWGTYEYEGEIFGSAVFGAEALEVKTGEMYVWVYTTF